MRCERQNDNGRMGHASRRRVRTGFKFSHGWMISIRIQMENPEDGQIVRRHSISTSFANDYSLILPVSYSTLRCFSLFHSSHRTVVFSVDLIALDNCILTQGARSTSNKSDIRIKWIDRTLQSFFACARVPRQPKKWEKKMGKYVFYVNVDVWCSRCWWSKYVF